MGGSSCAARRLWSTWMPGGTSIIVYLIIYLYTMLYIIHMYTILFHIALGIYNIGGNSPRPGCRATSASRPCGRACGGRLSLLCLVVVVVYIYIYIYYTYMYIYIYTCAYTYYEHYYYHYYDIYTTTTTTTSHNTNTYTHYILILNNQFYITIFMILTTILLHMY